MKNDLIEIAGKNSKLKRSARFWLQMLRFYFRIEVEGLENIPAKGGALIVPNHSGFAGTDAVLLTYILKRETKRRARILAHRAFFDFSATLKKIVESHGLKKASVQAGVDILKSNRLLIIFPEGETGNFKSTYERYRLQKFRTGFLRIAAEAEKPIIPCTIVGAEESHLNLGNLNLSMISKNLRIPLPVSLIPLPAKWKIKFHPPIMPSELLARVGENPDAMQLAAAELQKTMQKRIDEELKKRAYVYTRSTAKLARSLRERLEKTLRRRPLLGRAIRRKSASSRQTS